jgi:hypothetical protein
MPDPTLRFAAGSPERRFSSVWRLWVHGSDVYLGARILLRMFKFSMHQSGQWISAFTSESGAMLDTGSRRHKTWLRPAEFTPGWTQGPSVLVPWIEWHGQFQLKENPPASTVWVPGPEQQRKLVFNVLFSSASTSPEAINSVSQPGDWIVGSLPLSNRGAVWVQARQVAMSPEEQKGIASVEREFRGIQVSGDLDAMNAWGLWITSSPVEGIPLLVQFQLGRRHFQARDQAGDR